MAKNKKGTSSRSGTAPPADHQFQPGRSGNPRGRPSAGATLRDWLNQLAAEDATEAEVRQIARDRTQPPMKRAAAERILRTLEAGDLADFQDFIDGTATLGDLRKRGINTEVVKKAKRRVRHFTSESGEETVIETEIELHDRSGDDFDRISDRTDGKPTQRVEFEGDKVPHTIRILFPGDPGFYDDDDDELA